MGNRSKLRAMTAGGLGKEEDEDGGLMSPLVGM